MQTNCRNIFDLLNRNGQNWTELDRMCQIDDWMQSALKWVQTHSNTFYKRWPQLYWIRGKSGQSLDNHFDYKYA